MSTERRDVYAHVTGKIIAAIEAGAGEFRMPWHHRGGDQQWPRNLVTELPYRGINILNLWLDAEEKGFTSGIWATYRQWQERGAQVRKGEKASQVVCWQQGYRKDPDEKAEEGESGKSEPRFFATTYAVFNAAQVDGYSEPRKDDRSAALRIEHAERFFADIPAVVDRGGTKAYYNRETDHVQVPEIERFETPVAFYSVLAHELTHWTGAPSRLDRALGLRFGDEGYAMEELVAELNAAFVCADLGIENEPRRDHAAYIAPWLEVLKRDKRAVFTAASKAQLANDYFFRCSQAKAA